MHSDAPDQTTIGEYVRPLRKRWWLIVLIVVAVTCGTYLYYDRQPEVYSSTSQLYVEPSSLDQILFGTSGPQGDQTTQNLALLLQTPSIAQVAARILDYEGDPRVLLASVTAQAQDDTAFIAVTANAGTARKAAEYADAFSQAFIQARSRQIQRQAETALDVAEKELERLGRDPAAIEQRRSLETRIQRLQLIGSLPVGGAGIRQVEAAVVPAAPIQPQPVRNAIFAFVVSLALGIGAAIALDRVDRRLHRVEDVEELFGEPVLAELPRVETPIPVANHDAVVSEVLREPFRRLQTNLDIVSAEKPLCTIVVASAAPGEGKSLVALNLALAYREAGQRVALLDADFRKPSVHRMLDIDSEAGLAHVLSGASQLDEALQELPLNGASASSNGSTTPRSLGGAQAAGGALAVLTAGMEPANPAAALGTERMQEVLFRTEEQFDVVLIDSPPVLAVSDALPLLATADGVLLVTRMGVTTRDSIQRLMAELARVPDVELIGVVANAVPPRAHRSRAYGDGYGYYTSSRG
jgi:Mrp family chromosome partitioning ATPase/capsular polysaccharide biosynthesis protein